ncbi:S41 family peptidase [Mucilaginibacter sp. RB4R14]|uniref:S41 family peptidase n=1 Tax=Mucilaginibacter aurantiaciroseus TaxID=2949308 RepID=UPI0020919FE3|nr:S41 family peptidase [Mucilaginibacter aurantiaciroseus]MCO5937029.1 S41 family peptidase [Mucilaginibacter aurantiaciroseus]
MQFPLLAQKRFFLYLVLFIPLIQSACKKDTNNRPDYPAGSNENANTWILDSLKRYYYWNAAIPSNPDISVKPQNFFASLRNPADRFSYMVIPNDPSTYSPSNKSFGFDYSTVQEQSTGKVIGIVKLVLHESPASRAGLKRGDYIRKINGQQLTKANAVTLQQEILKSTHFSLGLAELTGSAWTDTRSVEVSAGVILDQRENSKIIETQGKKIGYLYFHDFSPGLASSLKTTFASFKSAGITELILDLRYNSGGQVAEAAGLSAMIAAGINYDIPFITYKGNRNGGARTESIGSAATFDGTVNFNALLQNNLALTRICILGTAATASASEVMINNLKPYMQVVLIGEKTRGKDEASFAIFDARNPKQVLWEMHPIIYKLFNTAGKGGYSAGISPDIIVNEMDVLPLLPFGDENDPLVKAAIARITAIARVAVSGLPSVKTGAMFFRTVLTDTRKLAAENSIVITHR